MNKYNYAVKVEQSITDIMNLPCVVKCEKVSYKVHTEDGETWCEHTAFIFTLESGIVARFGDWIVRDVCDHWRVMSDREYQEHKDDTI